MKRLWIQPEDVTTDEVECVHLEEVDPRRAKERGFRIYRVHARKKTWTEQTVEGGATVKAKTFGPLYVASVALEPDALFNWFWALEIVRSAIRHEPKGTP